MKELRDQGLWWLPGHENVPVAGTLVTTVDDFPHLELIGAFHEIQCVGSEPSVEIILGVAGGRLVTLYNCVVAGSKIQSPGLHTERYIAQFVLLGTHFLNKESVVFHRVAVEYDALFEWAGLSGLRMEHGMDAKGHLESIRAEFRFPDSPSFAIAGATISIETRGNAEGLGFTPRIEIAQTPALVITPNTPLHLEEYLTRYVHDLTNFLTLAVGGPVRMLRFAGMPKWCDRESEGAREVEILFLNRDRFVVAEKRRWDMLFTLPPVRSEVEKVLRRWFDRAEALRAIYDLYFGTLFQRGAYVHQRFLSLAQALESFHRRVNGGHHLPESAFQPLLQRLIATINAPAADIGRDARQAFCNKLAYFNEISLRRRLKELVGANRPYVSLLIRNETRFVKRVVATRNYYTHYDASSAAEAVPPEQLHYLSDQMQFLLEICLLAELGFERSTIDQLVSQHQRYLRWTQGVATFDPLPNDR